MSVLKNYVINTLTPNFTLLKLNAKNFLFNSASLKIYLVDEKTLSGLLCRGKNDEAIRNYLSIQSIDEFTENDTHTDCRTSDESFPLRYLTLNVSHDCNLNCDYCYARNGRFLKESFPRFMSPETAVAAVRLALRERTNKTGHLSIDFFGGEPLLNFETIKAVLSYIDRIDSPIAENIQFTISTNGTLLNDSIFHVLDEHSVKIYLSLDGNEALHDKHRKTVHGSGTYRNIIMNIQEHVCRDPSRFSARATISPDTVAFKTIFDHFDHLGFTEYGFDIASGTVLKEDTDWSPEDLSGYEDSFREYIESVFYKIETERYIPPIFLLDALYRLHKRNDRTVACRMGSSLIVVTPEGAIYPCYKVVDMEDMCIGTVTTGIEHSRRKFLCPMPVSESPSCSVCWIRLLCGWGCPASADGKSDSAVCNSKKIFWKWIFWLYLKLQSIHYPFSILFGE